MLNEPRLDDNAAWKQRFRAPVIHWTQVAEGAPDRGLAASNKSGISQLYAWDVRTGELRQLTDRPKGQVFGSLSPDGRYVYYLDDQDGNEIGHYVRVPFEGGAPEDITPDMPPYSSFSFSQSRAGNRLGMTVAQPDGYHVHMIELDPEAAPDALRELHHSRSIAFGPTLSHNGEVAVVTSTERGGRLHMNLLAFDAESGNQLGELWDGPETSVQPVQFSPLAGDTRLLAITNRTGANRPLIWDPRSGERTDLELGDLEGEVQAMDWSEDGKRLLLCQFNHAVQRLYLYDLQHATLTRLDHPGGTYGPTYFGPTDEIFTQWQDSTHPSQIIALDGNTGVPTRTLLVAGDVPPSRPWKSVTFTSSDGQAIQGWLGVPEGEGPFPTILHMIGGPGGVQVESFAPSSQVWLDHGFAFLTINYRGCSTFGKQFREQIWGNLGHWEVEDMVAARDWLVEQDIARPDQILLTGWSYGGYLTLMGLGKRPDLWAGGMAGIAIADWAVQYEDTADTLRGVQVALLGGTPQENPEQYARSSPITYAERVAAPVLIIQGRNDTRTPARPIEIYEAKMQELGKDIEVHWFDAGHLGSFAQIDEAIEHHELMLRFAYRVLS